MKKKAILLATGGGGLLVVTSVAIAIPVVLASSNSDEQTLKEAQVALENLTIDQKTVNLTKVTNQKLPSAFKISSMETLNALLKKAITTLNGITYQLWVIKTDNTKGEMVVEIEIKKGTVIKTVNFTIVGFKTTTKAILNEEARTLDESNFYYDGKAFDMSKDASFYDDKAKVSGVKLSNYTLLTASQVEEISKATLKITYTLKNGQTSSGTQTFSYSGFNKLQDQKDDVATAKVVLANLTNTNILDQSKTPSQVSYDNVADFFKKTALDAPSGEDVIALRKVDITIEVVARSSNAQTIKFTINSRPVGKIDRTSLIVNQFKEEEELTQDQKDVAAAKVVLANLANTNILDDSQTASQISYGNLADFFEKTALDAPSVEDDTVLSKVIITIAQTIKDDTSQTVTFTISSVEPSGASDTIQLEVTGFKSQILVQSKADVDDALAKIKNDTIKGDNSQLPSQMSISLIKVLPGFPPTTTNGVHFSVVIKNDDDINSELTFTLIAKKNDQSASKEITIKGFKELNQDQKDVAIVKKSIDDHGHGTIKDQTKFADEVSFFVWHRDIWDVFDNDVHNTSLVFLLSKYDINANKKVTLTCKEEVDSKDDTKKILTTTISSNNDNKITATSITIISGFASRKQVQPTIDAAKALLDKLDQGTINSNTNSASQVTYKDIADLIEQTSLENFNAEDQAIIDQVTITIATEPKDDTSQTVTFTITKRGGSSATSELEISGFALQPQSIIDVAKALLDKLDQGTINSNANSTSQVTYKDIADLIEQTNLENFNAEDQAIINQVTITIATEPREDTSQTVTFTITKRGGSSATSELEISGFASQAQVDISDALAKIGNNTIKSDSTKLPSQMTILLIKELPSFPSTTSNGVDFDVKEKTLVDSEGIHYDMSGKLIIILKASKNGINDTKELTISGFKTRPQSAYQDDVAKALAKIENNTISGDNSKLPSTMDVDSIKTLAGFPPSSNGVDFDVEIKTLSVNDGTSTDISGELIITLRASISGESQTKEITISGFKRRPLIQDEIDVANALTNALTNATIKGDNSKLPSTMDANSVKALSSFSSPTSNDVHFDVEVIVQFNNKHGTLTITLIATKKRATKKQELTISGFQTIAIANKKAVDNYQVSISKVIRTTTKNDSAYSNEIIYVSVADFNLQTNANLNLPSSSIKVAITSENTKRQQVVTFTISKGNQIVTHQITVTGFFLNSSLKSKSR